jgi:hypothetical protein
MSKKRKKKPIPPLMTLKVASKRYDVIAAKSIVSSGHPLQGQCNSIEGRIYLDVDFFVSSQRSTLFHEAIHAVDHTYRIGLTETQVEALEVGLLALIDDNPQLLAFEGVG